MDREELTIAVVLSVPVVIGVALAALKTTLGSRPVLSVAMGLLAGGAVFALVAYATDREYEEGRGELTERVVARLVPERRTATRRDLLVGAGLGAAVTVFLWYIPLSPLLGGAVAGFLQGGSREDARTAGVLSGFLVPPIALTVALAGFLVVGAQVFGQFPFGAVVAAFVAVGALVYAVGLGALGGWVGGLLLDEEHERAAGA